MNSMRNLWVLSNPLRTLWCKQLIGSLAICGIGILATACNAVETAEARFDSQKAATLTPEQKAQMDVAFFNDFVIYTSPGGLLSSGGLHPRGDRIHDLAERGFEVAWLAEKLFDFHRFGYRNSPNAERHWNRLRALADGGDASAQCLIAKGAWSLQQYGFFKPPQSDIDKAYDYMERAAAQRHPQCSGDWGNHQYHDNPDKRAELNMYGANKGCAECMARVSVFFRNGWGVKKDLAQSWCWVLEATRVGDKFHYGTDKQIVLIEIMDSQPNGQGRPEELTQYRPGTNCTEIITTTESSIKTRKGN